ncbi:PEP-CTERM sorting domain-containing protein [Capilliphycus salinus ALCB114379]|uniref:PEP-CTERM sorting domain-containing protein n=1 Tax=Capilliphycus salinus TaxID=2768948 RepID=UPI0039A47245
MTTNFLKKLSIATVSTAAISLSFLGANPAQAANLINNGGFETGNLTDWSVTNNGSGGCDTDWNVNSTGTTGCFGRQSATEGTYAAYNSFDGDGPQEFRLEQSFSIAENVESAILSWSDTAVTQIFGSLDRHFRVDLFTDSDVFNVFDLAFEAGTVGEYNWTARSFDVTSFLQANIGKEVTLAFSNQIPQSFSGPAGFGLDNIALNVEFQESQAVPEPGTIAALGLIGLGGLLTKKKLNASEN